MAFNLPACLTAYGRLRGASNYLIGRSVLQTIKRYTKNHSIFGDKGAIRGGEHPGRLQSLRWLNDTPFYRDALEIVAEKSRHFWWGQQVNVGLVSWSLYLALEGRRRNISGLWAFLALAQLVNLSFAQNLFFAAVLLTPVPLPENVRDLTRSEIPSSSRYDIRDLYEICLQE